MCFVYNAALTTWEPLPATLPAWGTSWSLARQGPNRLDREWTWQKPKIPKCSHVSAQPLGHTGSSWSTFEVWARVGGFVTSSRAASLRSMETWCQSHGSNKSLIYSTKSTRFLDAFGWFWSRLDWFNLLVSQRTCRTWSNLAQERLVQRPFWGSFDKVQHSQPNSCILISTIFIPPVPMATSCRRRKEAGWGENYDIFCDICCNGLRSDDQRRQKLDVRSVLHHTPYISV